MFFLLIACTATPSPSAETPSTEPQASSKAALADVLDVFVEGEELAVTLRSPDTGCEQYADWWEVLDAQGALVYRRILGHAHVDEQPFTRGGGPVSAPQDDTLWVRAHMNPGGYGGQALTGTLAGGFQAGEMPAELGAGVETLAPLPEGCAF